MLTRRSVLVGAAALAACGGATPKKRVAITMDDFNLPSDPARACERDARIRSHLPVRAAGFVSGRHEDSAAFDDVLGGWAADGHMLANHTYSHMWSSRHDTDTITADIARNHRLLKDRDGFAPYFRFPFLDYGRNHAQRLEYFAWLKGAGYRVAPVTIDTFDWNVTDRLAEGNRTRVRNYWLGAVMEEAEYAHALGAALGYPSMPHQLLVHHNALNALYLGDLVARMRSEGWEVVDAKTALDWAPFQDTPPDIDGGGNWLGVRKRAASLDAPARPPALREFGTPAMDALGL